MSTDNLLVAIYKALRNSQIKDEPWPDKIRVSHEGEAHLRMAAYSNSSVFFAMHLGLKAFGIPVEASREVPDGEFRFWSRHDAAPIRMDKLPSAGGEA